MNDILWLTIDTKHYNFIKENKIEDQLPAAIQFENYKYDVIYINNSIIVSNTNHRIIICRDKLVFPNIISDKKFIKYILENTTKIIVEINAEEIEFYPSFRLAKDRQNKIYLIDLVLIEI